MTSQSFRGSKVEEKWINQIPNINDFECKTRKISSGRTNSCFPFTSETLDLNRKKTFGYF